MQSPLPSNQPPIDAPPAQRAEPAWLDPYDPESRRRWIRLGLLLLFTAVVYAPTVTAQFLWQDDRAITANPALRSPSALSHSWMHPRAQTRWRPLADAALYPQHMVWRNWNPGGYHAVGLGLHLLNVTLFWLLLSQLSVPKPLAGAALFALHPAAVHTVAWAAQQPVLLATACVLASLLSWTRWSDLPADLDDDPGLLERPWVLAILTTLFFVAALLTDTGTSCATPIVILLLAWAKREPFDRALRRVTPLLILSVIVTAIAVRPAIASVIGSGAGLWFHLFKIGVPHPLLISYDGWRSPNWLWLLPTFAALAALWTMRDRMNRRVVVAAGFAFAAMLLPAVILFDPQGGGVVSDPQQYLARTAIFALIGAAIPAIATVAIVAIFTAITLAQCSRCMTNTRAWEYVLKHQPDSRLAHVQLERYARLVELDPSDADARIHLGEDLLRKGEAALAAEQFAQAANLRPTDPLVWRRWASVDVRLGNTDDAVAHLQRALELDPRDDVARNNLATIYAEQGKANEAIEQYEQALHDNPQSADTHVNLARLYFAAGLAKESADHLRQAVKIDPRNFNAYMTAGDVLMKLNDPVQASRMLREAVKLRRDSADAFNLLGVTLAAQGQLSEAIYCFNKALDLRPDFSAPRQNLAAAQSQRDGQPTTRP